MNEVPKKFEDGLNDLVNYCHSLKEKYKLTNAELRDILDLTTVEFGK